MKIRTDLLKFLLTMLAMSVPFYILLSLEPYFGVLQTFVAGNVMIILAAMGFNPAQNGYFLLLNGKGLEVAAACIGWRSALAFIALVIATPHAKNRLRALSFIPSIYAFNLFRLSTSFLVKIFQPDLFVIVHDFLWTYSMTFIVLGLWWFWTKL